MDPQVQLELESRLEIVDDDAKPLAGSDGLYVRLAIIRYKPEKGLDRHLVLFAESQKLFDHMHDELKTPDWIREGFAKKWVYIEEVLRRPGPSDDISGYLKAVEDNENNLWIAAFNLVTREGMLEKFTGKIRGKTFGLPREDLGTPGLPKGVKFIRKDTDS